jgi:anti-sigma factor RsiW
MRTDCAGIQEALSLLLAGEPMGVPAEQAERVALHVASCDACARLKARLERADALLRASTGPSISNDELKLMVLRARSDSQGSASSGNASGQIIARRFLAAAGLIATLLLPAASYFIFDARRSSPPGMDAVATVFDVDVDF